MARTHTFNELYSVDISEFPGMVPEIGSSAKDATLEIISSVVRPDVPAAICVKNQQLLGPRLAPSPDLDILSLEDLDARYHSACEDRKEVCSDLRRALLRRSRANSRATSRADTSTRATSRTSARSTSRASVSRTLNSSMDMVSEHSTTPSSPSRCTLHADQALSTLMPHTSRSPQFVPAVFPFPEPIPHGPPAREPPPPPPAAERSSCDERQIEQELRKAERRRGTRQEKRGTLKYNHSGKRFFGGVSLLSGRERKMVVEDELFAEANRVQANSWISECKPSTWLPHMEKDLWVIAAEERKTLVRERARMLANMERMPFENWLEDVQEVERAVFGDEYHYTDHIRLEHPHATDEYAREILQKMGTSGNRGLISRQERDLAQQVALQTLRRNWPRMHDKDLKGFDTLATEVRQGICTLGETHGTIVRIVAIVVFRIERRGTLLVELGSWKKGKGTPMLRLPGLKQQHFEQVEDTLRRALNSSFLPFASGMKIGETSFSEYTGKSEAYGMPTAYQKTTQSATISDEFGDPVLPMVAHAKEVPPMFQKYQAFCLRTGDHHKIRLHTWMKIEDYEYLTTSPQGKEDLVQWFSTMSLDERHAMDSLAWTCDGLSDKRNSLLKVSATLLNDIRSKFKSTKEECGTSVLENSTQSCKRPSRLSVVDPDVQQRRTVTAAARVIGKTGVNDGHRTTLFADVIRKVQTAMTISKGLNGGNVDEQKQHAVHA